MNRNTAIASLFLAGFASASAGMCHVAEKSSGLMKQESAVRESELDSTKRIEAETNKKTASIMVRKAQVCRKKHKTCFDDLEKGREPLSTIISDIELECSFTFNNDRSCNYLALGMNGVAGTGRWSTYEKCLVEVERCFEQIAP